MAMKALLLSAMVFGPCLAGSVDRTAEDLEAGPEDAPLDPAAPVSPPGTQVQMSLSGSPNDYAATYWNDTFFPAIRTAINNQDVQFRLDSVQEGSTIVRFTVIAPGVALPTLQSIAAEIVAQANNPNSPLRTGVLAGIVLSATVTNPTPVPTTQDDGMSDAAIAGIVIGCMVGVGIIVVIIYYVACHTEDSSSSQAAAPYGNDDEVEMEAQAQAGEEKPYDGDEMV